MRMRKLKRRHLIYYLRVFDRGSGALLGHLVDVTVEGMMLVCEQPISPDGDFACEMMMPGDNGQDAKRSIVFDAHCLWCKKDVNPDFYAIGFQIRNISNDDVGLLGELIEAIGFQD